MQPSHRVSNLTSLLFAVHCISLFGGVDPPKQQPNDPIRATVNVVVAPTTVQRKTGDFITGLQIQDFEIYDNDRPQKITGDFRDSPFSLVVAVQRSADMAGMLPKIQKIGSVLTDVIVGLDGEVSVVGFDHGVQVMQDFTSDSDKVDRAMRNLKPGSYSHAAIDAVRESVRMLKNRPRERRRIVLVIAESWDKGSEASLRDALTEAEFANITVYALVVSTAAAELTSEPKPQPRPPFPTTAYNIPAGAPLTPTTLEQNYYLGNWVPLLINVFQSVENVFIDNTLDAFTRFTGGERFSFDSDRTLDKGLEKLNESLHAQYLLSYTPNNLNDGGFHEIKVVVKHPHLDVRSRAGYWIARKAE